MRISAAALRSFLDDRLALTGVRGSQRVTSQNPEATYEALEKYARDLTELARKSKLAADGFASRQDLDEATAAVGTARAKLVAAEETYQAAHLGPTREELAIADTKVKNAEAAVAVIAARAMSRFSGVSLPGL